MTRLSNRLCLLTTLLAIGAAPLMGCWMPGYRPGGPQATRDLHTFESTRDFPQSIEVVDQATNEVVWSIHVPIGEQVVIRFYEHHDPDNIERPALMRWEMMERGSRWGELTNAMPVPSYDARVLNVYLREADVAPGLEVGQSR